MSPKQNKDVIQQFYDQWTAGEIDFGRLVHPDITNHQPGSDETGVDKFRKAVEGVMLAVPDSRWTTHRLIAEDDLVVCHNQWSGTFRGTTFRGIPTSKSGAFSVDHVHIYRLERGRIIEHWVVRDDLGMMQQLAAIAGE
jgi:predicted ester cyclase